MGGTHSKTEPRENGNHLVDTPSSNLRRPGADVPEVTKRREKKRLGKVGTKNSTEGVGSLPITRLAKKERRRVDGTGWKGGWKVGIQREEWGMGGWENISYTKGGETNGGD